MRYWNRSTIVKRAFQATCATMLSLAGLLAGSAPAEADGRPSLEAIQEVMCAQADFEGRSYRPHFCEGRCDCFDAAVLDGPNLTASCEETAPGDILIDTQSDRGTCGGDFCRPDNVCAGSSFLPCASSDQCLPGETCTGTIQKFCRNPCTTNAQCTGNYVCSDVSGTACSSDTDCTDDEFCETDGQCKVRCSSDTECQIFKTATLTGFAGVGSPEPLGCALGAVVPTAIGSGDAIACLQQAEAQLGISCSFLCGDGHIDPGEQCDDGNVSSGDGCASDCTTE